MGKILALIVAAAFFSCSIKAQYVNIPDTIFRNYLRSQYPGCFNGAGQMDTTCTTILNEDSLTVDYFLNGGDPGIFTTPQNLEGIQYFKSLVFLETYSIPVSHIPALPLTLKTLILYEGYQSADLPQLPANLEYFGCRGYGLTALPVLPASLIYLDCSSSMLSALPVLPASLKYLNCSYNRITALPVLPGSLEHLDFSNTKIHIFPAALPAGLKQLYCSHDSISTIPVLPPGLTDLLCDRNQLDDLPALPLSLVTLMVDYNNITTLPVLPATLQNLYCTWNQLTSLPVLPDGLRILNAGHNNFGNALSAIHLPDSLRMFYCESSNVSNLPAALPAHLTYLSCADNHIPQLPAVPATLAKLYCYSNQLSELPALPASLEELSCVFNDIHCLPRLPELSNPNRSFPFLLISFDADKIKCTPNHPNHVNFNGHDTAGNYVGNLPLCNAINNSNHCQGLPVVSGNVFYDNNSNGARDANEPFKPNLRMDLSNGRFAFTNQNGYFEVGADSLGTYTNTAAAVNYFNVVPPSVTYNFNTYDTIVSQDYALQANTIKDSIVLKLTPINWAARPGFLFPYLISFENAGTTILSPNIVLNYDDTKLTYDSSSNASVINNGNSLSLSVGSFVPGEHQRLIAYFRVKTTAAIGDSILAKATISDNAVTAADSSKVFIRGSFDPNDKQATPELTPLQIINGAFIDYTIRFQNTGTDTAFNIVLSDTLNDDLQTNTLQVTASSHTCKTTVKDNVVFFEFLNILLPDSNVNELKSHGFVSFRIKPQMNVAANTIIPNSAAIYFDYNAPVITNTAGTLIKGYVVVPLKLISFGALPQTDNSTTLYWNTANETSTRHFVIEQSSDGIHFNAMTTVVAKGRANNSYSINVIDANNSIVYYRLKMVDNDGRFSFSPVIKIDRRKNIAGFSILTNPVNDFIIINNNDRSLNNTVCSIINTQGAIMKRFIVKQGSQTVDVKDLPTGIYYLRASNGSSRILVQR